MSERTECRRVCDDCPLREGYEGEPTVFVETGWEARGDISSDGRTASFELSNGKPIGERVSYVAMGAEVEFVVRRLSKNFRVFGSQFDSGEITDAFSNCEGPVQERTGFLRLRQQVVCNALNSLSGNR